MASLITIGFSFRNSEKQKMYNSINRITSKLVPLKQVEFEYCYDAENGDWKIGKHAIPFDEEKEKDLVKSEMFKISFQTKLKNSIINIFISKETLTESYAILINLNEGELMASLNSFDEINNFVDNFVIEIIKTEKCSYAYCDNYGMYEYEVEEVIKGKFNEFSIVYIPNENNLKIIKQNYELDGCTERNKNQVGSKLINLNAN